MSFSEGMVDICMTEQTNAWWDNEFRTRDRGIISKTRTDSKQKGEKLFCLQPYIHPYIRRIYSRARKQETKRQGEQYNTSTTSEVLNISTNSSPDARKRKQKEEASKQADGSPPIHSLMQRVYINKLSIKKEVQCSACLWVHASKVIQGPRKA